MSRQNPLFNGLKSVWRVGQTASILAQAGLLDTAQGAEWIHVVHMPFRGV